MTPAPTGSARPLVFLTYAFAIPWIARLARHIRATGTDVDVWVLDRREEQLALETGVFSRVVNLAEGFARAGSRARSNVEKFADIEREIGGPFFHRDVLIDRIFTIRNHMETPPAATGHRWRPDEIAALGLTVIAVVDRELQERPPLGIVGEVADFVSQLVYRYASAREVRYLSPYTISYVPDRLLLSPHDTGQWDACVERYRATPLGQMSDEAREHAANVLVAIRGAATLAVTRRTVGDYLPDATRRFGPARVGNVIRDVRTTRTTESMNSPHAANPELVTLRARLRRKVKHGYVRRGFETWAQRELPEGRIAAYLLHVEPEVVVDLWAFEQNDQLATIRNIAASLPADVTLVVKEHLGQSAQRDPWFYARLRAMPGVALLHDSFPTKSLLARSSLVLTLTGTSALEAMCLGVPAVVFGDIYYEHFAGIRRVRGYDELAKTAAALDGFECATEDEILRALAARFDSTTPGTWLAGDPTPPSGLDEETARSILDALTEG